MTSNEIIKALECCLKTNQAYKCRDCRYYNKTANCLSRLMTDTVDVINRQQAEIEQLKKISTEADNFARTICDERTLKGKSVADFEDLQEYIEKQKSEAIKEFADILAVKYKTTHYLPNDDDMIMVAKSDMDILVNEMLGENNV